MVVQYLMAVVVHSAQACRIREALGVSGIQ